MSYSWSDFGDWTSSDTLAHNRYFHTEGYNDGCVEGVLRACFEKLFSIEYNLGAVSFGELFNYIDYRYCWTDYGSYYIYQANHILWQFLDRIKPIYLVDNYNFKLVHKDPTTLNDYEFTIVTNPSYPSQYTIAINDTMYDTYASQRFGAVISLKNNSNISGYNPDGSDLCYAYQHWIENLIDLAIPYYANHNDNGGNWNGQTSIPTWADKNEILTFLGVSEVEKTNGFISKEWVYRKYQILEQLRWPIFYFLVSSERVDKVTSNENTWNEALISFNGGVFSISSNPTNAINHYSFFSNFSYIKYGIVRYAFPVNYTNNTGINRVFDMYAFFYQLGLVSGTSISTYEDNDFGSAKDTFQKIDNNVSVLKENSFNKNYGEINNNTCSEPVAFETRGYGATSIQMILKPEYNFKDW